jgi:hypothetical protein
MPRRRLPSPVRRAAAELALLLVVGLFMGAIGPYGTNAFSVGTGYLYWILCIVGGGLIGISLDATLGRRFGSFWPRLAADSILMTPAVTLLVVAVGWLVARQPFTVARYLALF